MWIPWSVYVYTHKEHTTASNNANMSQNYLDPPTLPLSRRIVLEPVRRRPNTLLILCLENTLLLMINLLNVRLQIQPSLGNRFGVLSDLTIAKYSLSLVTSAHYHVTSTIASFIIAIKFVVRLKQCHLLITHASM